MSTDKKSKKFTCNMASNSKFCITYRTILFLNIAGILLISIRLPSRFSIVQLRSAEAETTRYDPRPGYLVDTLQCKIVDMNPFPPTIRLYIKNESSQTCSRGLIIVKNNTLFYDKSHPNQSVSSCCFREIHRVSQRLEKYNKNADWSISFSKNCTPISNATGGTPVTTEFIEIQCKTKRNDKLVKLIQYNAAIFSPENHSKETRAKAQYWKGRHLAPPGDNPGTINEGPPSVLIIGIDTISRLHMIRSLPKTRQFLESNDFVEMKGYTKAGKNTFPNMMAALGGMRESRYPCFRNWSFHRLDDCPLIWKNFSRSNYITALLEDAAGIANFNYMMVGFVQKPVDYYLRPITVAYHGKLARVRTFRGCVSGMSQTEFMIDYLRRFVKGMTNTRVPYFLLSWFTTLTHDSMNRLKPMDGKFRRLLKDAVLDGSYNGNNTIILFMSDHGYIFGRFRETFLGRYEASLPFFYIRIPPALKLSHPHWYENLRVNSQRLTSPLDVHATLEDILSLSFNSSPEKPFPFTHSNWDPSLRRVYSLFEETPLNRTCESSGIPELYCRCGVTDAVSKESKNSDKFGEMVVRTLNLLLHETISNGKCIPLKFSKFLYLRELGEGELRNNFGKLMTFKDHLVALEAFPSSAHFEAKVRVFGNDTMTIIGDVSRINSYEGQNDCLKDYRLKNYCMCKDYFEAQQLAKRTKEAKRKKKAEDEKKQSTWKRFYKAMKVSEKTSVSVVIANSSG